MRENGKTRRPRVCLDKWIDVGAEMMRVVIPRILPEGMIYKDILDNAHAFAEECGAYLLTPEPTSIEVNDVLCTIDYHFPYAYLKEE